MSRQGTARLGQLGLARLHSDRWRKLCVPSSEPGIHSSYAGMSSALVGMKMLQTLG